MWGTKHRFRFHPPDPIQVFLRVSSSWSLASMSDLVVTSCGHLVEKCAGQLLSRGDVVVLLPRILLRRNRVVPDPVFANPHFVSLQIYGRSQGG